MFAMNILFNITYYFDMSKAGATLKIYNHT